MAKIKNISNQEMMRTFNCGIGFVLFFQKNIHKVKKFFPKNFKPYEIGHISKDKLKINLINSLKW